MPAGTDDGHVLIDGRLHPGPQAQEELERVRLRRMCVPPSHWHCTLENHEGNHYPVPHLLRTAAQHVPGQREVGLVLCGPNGTGKTHLGVALLLALMHGSRRMLGLFVNAQLWVGRCMTAMHEDRYVLDPNDVLTLYDAILLDDLGTERATEYATEQMRGLIDHCYRFNRLLIVTTNLSRSEIEQRYGRAVVSRLDEMCLWSETKGSDRRKGTENAGTRVSSVG